MTKLRRVLIMAGGTGGHIFPGIAVARAMQAAGIDVQWMGTEKGLESRVVPNTGIVLHKIAIAGLRGKSLKTKLLLPLKMLYALIQAIKILHQFKPDIVLGMGGFVSGPGGVACFILRIPLVIHEQNAKAGLTNRLLARFATKVLAGFPNAFAKNIVAIMVGNPVREEFVDQNLPLLRSSAKAPRVLIVGGSLGAHFINQLIPKTFALFAMKDMPDIWHQTGQKDCSDIITIYESSNIPAKVEPFITDMLAAYRWADIVICRAGALTIAELSACGVPSILIPLPHAADDHQTENAKFLAQNSAAMLMPQTTLTPEDLATAIRELIFDDNRLLKMAEAAYALRRTDATQNVLTICQEIAP